MMLAANMLDDVPEYSTDEERVQLAYDQAAWTYDKAFICKRDRAEDAHVTRQLVESHLTGQLLDIGSGTGLLLDMIPLPATHYTGIDLSPIMVEVANQKHPKHNFEIGSMEDMRNFSDASFDSVASLFGAFSHSTTPYASTSEMWRVLRPGGRLYLMAYGPRYRRRKSYIMRDKEVPAAHFTGRQLRKRLEERFTKVKVRGMSCLTDLLPNWFPQNVHNLWMKVETATVGRVVPTACYFLIATATKARGVGRAS